jgi:hypothetical protein
MDQTSSQPSPPTQTLIGTLRSEALQNMQNFWGTPQIRVLIPSSQDARPSVRVSGMLSPSGVSPPG